MEATQHSASNEMGVEVSKATRCCECRRKLGLAKVFECKCGKLLCCSHRYPESHVCTVNWKALSRVALAANNPQVVACKVAQI
jgi:AN1-type zinc finger and ubiquitin domain-containing protein 1